MHFLRLGPIFVLFACDCSDERVTCTTTDGRAIDVGDSFYDGCNTCMCESTGRITCTARECIDAGPPFDASFDAGFDSGTDGSVDASSDSAGSDADSLCATTETSTLDGVHIAFPSQRCAFTLAEAAAGISIDYDIVVSGAPANVYTRPQDLGGCGMPGPSGFISFENVAGGSERYCVCDVGLCPFGEVASSPVDGSHRATFMWTGRNWNGPSDFGAPLGDPFPPGRYTLTVSSIGRVDTTEYRFEGTFAIELVP